MRSTEPGSDQHADGGTRTADAGASALYDPPHMGAAPARYRLLESVEAAYADRADDLRTALYGALQHFPELSETTVTVALADPDDGRYHAKADVRNDLTFVPADGVSNVTLYHELAHLAIASLDERGADVATTSEEFCSILAVARMPAASIDRESIPYLGTPDVPRADWPGICRCALEYREDHHAYVQQCRDWLGTARGEFRGE